MTTKINQSNAKKFIDDKLLIGRSEWCALPELNLPAIKAKIDSGARTSSLHAEDIKPFKRGKKTFVRFTVYPLSRNRTVKQICQAQVLDRRYVTSSNGKRTKRYVVRTDILISERRWPIELTLSSRDTLKYRMLIGRQALNHMTLIDTSLACNQTRYKRKYLHALYSHKIFKPGKKQKEFKSPLATLKALFLRLTKHRQT